jgi:hypothetical protein
MRRVVSHVKIASLVIPPRRPHLPMYD